MMDSFTDNTGERALSPTIGVALLVVIVLLLATVLGVFVTGIGLPTDTGAGEGTVTTDVTDSGVVVSVADGGEGQLRIKSDQETKTIPYEAGKQITINASADSEVQIIYLTEDGKPTSVINTVGVENDAISSPGSGNGSTGAGSSSRWSVAHDSFPTSCSASQYNGSGTDSDPYEIENDWDLQCINAVNLSADYELVNDINASLTDQWNGGRGFLPIGPNPTHEFGGTFDGNGHEIKGLYMDWDFRTQVQYAGMFGMIHGTNTKVQNFDLYNVDITFTANSSIQTGGAVGQIAQARLTGVTVHNGTVDSTSPFMTGGVAGYANSDCIETSGNSNDGAIVNGGGTPTYGYNLC